MNENADIWFPVLVLADIHLEALLAAVQLLSLLYTLPLSSYRTLAAYGEQAGSLKHIAL